MEEEWRDIEEFEGYQVSNKGNVRSFTNGSYGYRKTPHQLHPGTDLHGRKFVILGPKRKVRQVHRLEAIAFIPNPHNYPIVRHLDDNPANNDLSNLSWGTQKMNMADCKRNGHLKYFTKEDLEKSAMLHRKPVKIVNTETGEELYFRSAREADDYLGVAKKSVSNSIGIGYRVKGYKAEYVNNGINGDEEI